MEFEINKPVQYGNYTLTLLGTKYTSTYQFWLMEIRVGENDPNAKKYLISVDDVGENKTSIHLTVDRVERYINRYQLQKTVVAVEVNETVKVEDVYVSAVFSHDDNIILIVWEQVNNIPSPILVLEEDDINEFHQEDEATGEMKSYVNVERWMLNQTDAM